MKKISDEQINQVLQAVYTTNMPVAQFDALKTFFSKLEDVEPKTETND